MTALLWWVSGLLSLLSGVATRLLLSLMLPQIGSSALVTVNYRGRVVPNAGVVPVVVGCAGLFVWLLLPLSQHSPERTFAQSLLLAVLAFAFIGFTDDVFGDKSTGGLSGHWRRLLAGELTTGGLKAIFGIIASLSVAGIVSDGFGPLLVNGLLIALSANAVNLFDLRPGRALKIFFVVVVALFVLSARHPSWIVVFPFLTAIVAYGPADLGGKALLGDTGANALGALLGFVAAVTLTWPLKIAFTLALSALHFVAERISLSRIIEAVPLLQRLDEWGR